MVSTADVVLVDVKGVHERVSHSHVCLFVHSCIAKMNTQRKTSAVGRLTKQFVSALNCTELFVLFEMQTGNERNEIDSYQVDNELGSGGIAPERLLEFARLVVAQKVTTNNHQSSTACTYKNVNAVI
jgi:hypothetical protein